MPMVANPVLPGCHPDPSVCRVGDDFYLVTSTFEYWPGLPIFHSRDLATWSLLGHAIDRPDQVDLSTVPSSGGLFAATIRFHDGVFFLTCTVVHGRGRRGNFVLTASDPAGPWSDPLWLDGAPGIDPSLFFDDDGRSWLTTARLAEPGAWPGQTDIWLREVVFDRAGPSPMPTSVRLVGAEHLVWRGAVTGAVWAEGPHLYRVDGRYILLASEGGTEHDHAVSVAAADRVTGPYVGNPRNPVLTHRHLGRSFPVAGVGHADLVQAGDGSWWALALGSRPVPPSRAEPLGRETFLTPVAWEDGWPVFAPGLGHLPDVVDVPQAAGTVVSTDAADTADAAATIPWSLVRTTDQRRIDVFPSDPGRLELHPRPVSLSDVGAPSFAGRRQQHHRAVFRATFALWNDPAVRAGLAVRQSESDWISLTLRPLPPEGFDAGRSRVEASRHPAPSRAVAVELRACRAGVESIVRTGILRDLRASCELIVASRDGRYDFSIALSSDASPADSGLALGDASPDQAPSSPDRSPSLLDGTPPPARKPSSVSVGELDGDFLTTPLAGGFLGVWLGVCAESDSAGSETAMRPVRVSSAEYAAGDG
jgi:xylan 1,4-beta-xylosidase